MRPPAIHPKMMEKFRQTELIKRFNNRKRENKESEFWRMKLNRIEFNRIQSNPIELNKIVAPNDIQSDEMNKY